MRFDEIEVGLSASVQMVVQTSDLDSFARLSGDYSPIHMDADEARRAGFADRVAHGLLVAAYVSRLVGMKLPGTSALLLSETLRFHRPVHPGQALVLEGQVRSRSESTHTIDLDVTIRTGSELVVSGSVRVLVRE